jgi:poly(3-hydroxybutyrate) depolymerase
LKERPPRSRTMRASTVPVTLVVLVIMSQSLAIVSHVELERGLAHLETDYGGPITYTDEHTDATLGSSNRGATLTMPGGHDYERPLPLVVALHGYSSSGSFNAWWMSLYDSVHENEHLLLTPDGSMNIIGMRYWNATDACCNLFNTQVDDVTFLESLIVQAVQNYGADPEGVVLIGHSNGAFMSHRMACERGGIIESIVSLNGATWDDFSNNCPDTGRPNILQVHGTGDTVIQYDGGSTFGGMYPSAPQTTTFWADRSGCEMSWTNLGSIDLTNSDGVAETDNLEHLNCTDGNRVTHWRINNASHSPLLNDKKWPSETLGWALEDFVRDSDGDGHRDDVDAFVYDSGEWLDNDDDGIGDNADTDDDNDGLTDSEEAGLGTDPLNWDTDDDEISDLTDCDPIDGELYTDTDLDGACDEVDEDADGDGWENELEFDCMTGWLDVSSVPSDLDHDGICDVIDPDDDGDGYFDNDDLFPLDASEWSDNDGDGFGDNADTDDDGDGWSDDDELSCGTNPWGLPDPEDMDEDGVCDPLDSDVDGDGHPNDEDHYPLDSSEWADTDSDGVGDNSDAFPNDSNETLDTDEDGVGDNADAFPSEPSEWSDIDGDGVGDNTDAFPADPLEWIDTDGDGFGDNSDDFPMDVEEWLDTDGDGVGNNADAHPLDSSKWEEDPNYVMIGLAGALAMIAILAYTRQRHD